VLPELWRDMPVTALDRGKVKGLVEAARTPDRHEAVTANIDGVRSLAGFDHNQAVFLIYRHSHILSCRR